MITSELKFTQLDTSTYSALLEDKKGILVDIRTSEEFEEFHLDGAINIDFHSSGFLEEFNKIPKESSIFIYCDTGSKSLAAMQLLRKAGFNEVYDLKGGIIAWQIANTAY